MKKNWLLIAAFIFIPLWTGWSQDLDKVLSDLGFDLPTEEFPVPEFSLTSLSGEEVSISDYRGKVVFLNFWATWCPPCRAEMPSMQEVYERWEDKDFEMVAVNLREDNKTVEKYMEEGGYTFPVLMDKEGQIGGLFGVTGIPTTFMVDKEGRLIARLVGTREWDVPEFEALLEKLVLN